MSECTNQSDNAEQPVELPKGILIDEIPKTMDIIFTSIRYVLNTACLDKNNELKDNFIQDADCSKKIYSPEARNACRLLLDRAHDKPRTLFIKEYNVTEPSFFKVRHQLFSKEPFDASPLSVPVSE